MGKAVTWHERLLVLTCPSQRLANPAASVSKPERQDRSPAVLTEVLKDHAESETTGFFNPSAAILERISSACIRVVMMIGTVCDGI